MARKVNFYNKNFTTNLYKLCLTDMTTPKICIHSNCRLYSLGICMQFFYSRSLLGKRDLKTGRTSGEPVRKKQNNEESYEAIPRKAKWDDKEEVEYLLPIKSGDGIIHQIKKKKAEVQIDDNSDFVL